MIVDTQANQAVQFEVLSTWKRERIYEAALACLERTGVNVLNNEARSMLGQAGARVDGIRVRIPPRLIREAVATCPSSFTLWGRDGRASLQVAPGNVYFGPGPTCTYFVDPATGERRATRRGDAALTARVCDALDNVDYVMGLGLISDVTSSLAPVYEFAEMVANTGKPILPWAYSADNVSDIYEIGVAVAGGREALRERPFFALFATFQSPLVQTREDLANVLWAADHDIPVVYLGGGTAGTTAPITGAGSLVITLAGALSGLCILQLKKAGAPVCLGGVPQAMDLRAAWPTYGSPEMSLYSAALSEIYQYLGLPFMGTAGASEAKVLDLQAAIESTLQVILSALSGATLVHDVGFLDCAGIGSLESVVMNDEIISMARRILRGIEVNDETLMLDLVDQVGPGGEFMSHKETARRCRAEIWNPRLLDRQPWVNWELSGSQTMQVRVQTRLWEILATHNPPPLPEKAQEAIQSILRAAETRAAPGTSPATANS
jgi:trimethylamine--corrinoid protein Co-methyltransferase